MLALALGIARLVQTRQVDKDKCDAATCGIAFARHDHEKIASAAAIDCARAISRRARVRRLGDDVFIDRFGSAEIHGLAESVHMCVHVCAAYPARKTYCRYSALPYEQERARHLLLCALVRCHSLN